MVCLLSKSGTGASLGTVLTVTSSVILVIGAILRSVLPPYPTSSFIAPPRSHGAGLGGQGSALAVARRSLNDFLDLSPHDYRLQSHYRTPGLAVNHYYFQLLKSGRPVANEYVTVNVADDIVLVSMGAATFSQSIGEDHNEALPVKPSAPRDALSALLHHLGVAADHAADLPEPSVIGTEGEVASPTYVFWPVWAASNLEVRATLEALRIPAAANHSSVRTVPVWTLTIRLDPHHYVVQLRQSDLALVAVWDYARPACYLVYPWPLTNPDEGPRQLVCDPWHPDASPLGWHRTNDTFVYLDTQGNNVRAQLYSPDRQSGSEVLIRPQGTGPDHSTFAFPLDLSQEPTAYGEASVTQLFYHTNMMHDLLYGYGFDEPAGNFQTNNFGRGGLGNDALVAYAQNPDRFNNAYFNTPPDGEAPTMWMFLFNLTTPHRDDTLDRTVVVHEYTHGLTARLTGGPANTFCLLFGESAGLGEGWSDFVAAILQVRDVGNGTNSTGIPYPPIAIGAYVSGKPGGLRLHPFSTDRTVNPVTYSWLNRPEYFEIHAAGEVWASLLYEVFWNLVDRHGFDADWWNHGGHEKGSPSQGNVLALQLVVDGLKLQPCFPTFLTARDAIIHAEDLRTHGTNRCEVWRGFAKRGLGLAANYSQGMYTDDFTVPTGC